MQLPDNFRYLLDEPGPQMLQAALDIYGVKEYTSGDNPKILSWAKELGIDDYTHDAIPWCGLAMAIIAKRGRKVVPHDPLWALNWKNFGHQVPIAMLGDVLVMSRDGGGHVTMYVGEDASNYYGIGGNQSDSVNIAKFSKSRKPFIRRPNYINQPENVRQIRVDAQGIVAGKES